MSAEMHEMEYPAVKDASSRVSASGQKSYRRLLTLQLTFPLIAAVTALVVQGREAGVPIAILFVLGLATSVSMQLLKPEREWFKGRVAAESLKQVAWEYAMRVPPYDEPAEDAAHKSYLGSVHDLLEEVKDIRHLIGEDNDDPQATGGMRSIRARDWKARGDIYVTERLKHQRDWYRGQAKQSGQRAKQWLLLVSVLQLTGVVLAILRAASLADASMFGLVAAATGAASAWLQSKRYQELRQSYGFAAAELSDLVARAGSLQSEAELFELVSDSESRISREHSAWAAKRSAKTMTALTSKR